MFPMPKYDNFFPKIKVKNSQNERVSVLRPKMKDKGMKFAVGYCVDFPELHCTDIPIIGNIIGQKRLISQMCCGIFLGLVSEYVFLS